MIRRVAPAIVVLALFACSSDDSDSGESGASGSGATMASFAECEPARPFEADSYPSTVMSAGAEQEYWVLVPSSYDGSHEVALWLLLPGGAGDAEPALAGWGPTLASGDAVVVVPDIPFAGSERNTDFMRAVIDDVTAVYCVDSSRVYAIGSSSSAGFAASIADEASDRIAAFAVGIGSFTAFSEPDQPVPVLAWTGDTDLNATEQSVEVWADNNGCDSEPVETDLGSGISHSHYEGCDAPVEFYYFAGMGHQVPNHDCLGEMFYCAEYEEFDFKTEAAKFFDANPLQ